MLTPIICKKTVAISNAGFTLEQIGGGFDEKRFTSMIAASNSDLLFCVYRDQKLSTQTTHSDDVSKEADFESPSCQSTRRNRLVVDCRVAMVARVEKFLSRYRVTSGLTADRSHF